MSEHTLKAKCSLFDSCDFWKVTILPLMCAHSCITWRINLIFTEKLVNQCRNNPAKLFCSKPYRFYAILNRGDLGFLLCLSWMNASVYVFFKINISRISFGESQQNIRWLPVLSCLSGWKGITHCPHISNHTVWREGPLNRTCRMKLSLTIKQQMQPFTKQEHCKLGHG